MADETPAVASTVEEPQAQIEKLTADLAQVTSDKEASELSLRNCQEALKKAETDLQAANDSLATVAADRGNLHDELKSLQEAKDSAEANVKALQEKLDSDESKTLLAQAEAKIEELLKSNTELSIQAKAWGIISEEQARDFVKKNYKPGPKVKVIMVTQDGQVFYDSDIQGSGQAHVLQKEVKSFVFKNEVDERTE